MEKRIFLRPAWATINWHKNEIESALKWIIGLCGREFCNITPCSSSVESVAKKRWRSNFIKSRSQLRTSVRGLLWFFFSLDECSKDEFHWIIPVFEGFSKNSYTRIYCFDRGRCRDNQQYFPMPFPKLAPFSNLHWSSNHSTSYNHSTFVHKQRNTRESRWDMQNTKINMMIKSVKSCIVWCFSLLLLMECDWTITS